MRGAHVRYLCKQQVLRPDLHKGRDNRRGDLRHESRARRDLHIMTEFLILHECKRLGHRLDREHLEELRISHSVGATGGVTVETQTHHAWDRLSLEYESRDELSEQVDRDRLIRHGVDECGWDDVNRRQDQSNDKAPNRQAGGVALYSPYTEHECEDEDDCEPPVGNFRIGPHELGVDVVCLCLDADDGFDDSRSVVQCRVDQEGRGEREGDHECHGERGREVDGRVLGVRSLVESDIRCEDCKDVVVLAETITRLNHRDRKVCCPPDLRVRPGPYEVNKGLTLV